MTSPSSVRYAGLVNAQLEKTSNKVIKKMALWIKVFAFCSADISVHFTVWALCVACISDEASIFYTYPFSRSSFIDRLIYILTNVSSHASIPATDQ